MAKSSKRRKRINNKNNKRREIKKKAVEYKGGKCQLCGYNRCSAALTFHHINPEEKRFGISDKAHEYSWDIIKKELDNCVLLCSNCHTEVHEGMIDPTHGLGKKSIKAA